jgi:hypothetical protein
METGYHKILSICNPITARSHDEKTGMLMLFNNNIVMHEH